jgi:transcriptional regulator with PAS, ATPase and Fis domain
VKQPACPPLELLERRLEALDGAALILDARLAVVHATEAATALLAPQIPVGPDTAKRLFSAPGGRAIASALEEGRPGTATLTIRGEDGRERALILRALPIEARGRRAGAAPLGWALLLDAESHAHESDGPLLFHGIWTRDPTMKRVLHIAERAARRDAVVLVRGETGTGKELVARAIHALSPRAKGPFAAINCAALPASLLESELFGHVRGAFTGAVRDQPGFFRTAHGGTLFLDEVAEMPLELQAKLLRVLETRSVLPVGAREPVPVDVRIVAATHTSLRRAVEAGRFRADLMYRLRVIPIFLPPLRARPDDIALLVQKFVEELNRQGGRQVARVAPAALDAMRRYPWPGNVRELRNALEYAYVIGEGPVLVPSDLPPEIVEPRADPWAAEPLSGAGTPRIETRRAVEDAREWFGAGGERDARRGCDESEAARIRRALERAGGRRDRAARLLGISRTTLWRRMRELGLAPDGRA